MDARSSFLDPRLMFSARLSAVRAEGLAGSGPGVKRAAPKPPTTQEALLQRWCEFDYLK
jgi:hypothetical protein